MKWWLAVFCLLLIGCSAEEAVVEEIAPSEEPAEQEGCFCATLYDPVCGSDGETYSNACRAQCAGITETTRGECS